MVVMDTRSQQIHKSPIIAFDIGGTWFRSGLVTGDEVLHFRRDPSASFTRYPRMSAVELRELLAEYISGRTQELAETLGAGPVVAISMGAAVNAHNGHILSAAPLWGPHEMNYDLQAELDARAPGFEWHIVNDVTAGLHDLVGRQLPAAGLRRVMLVTVSTGIAARTYDYTAGCIPVDRDWGIQGEIGHLPATCQLAGAAVSLRCDCGGPDHLNAFASGRGILELYRMSSRSATTGTGADFAMALDRGDPLAADALSSAVDSLARALVPVFVLDPDVGELWLTGGVAEQLGERYLNALVAALDRQGMYQASDRDPEYFRDRIKLARPAVSNLTGAARAVTSGAGRRRSSGSVVQSGTTGWQVRATRDSTYEVTFTRDALDPANDVVAAALASPAPSGHIVVFMDKAVDEFHGPAFRAYLESRGLRARHVVVDSGEDIKSLRTVRSVVRELDRLPLPRRSGHVVAVGGGTLLDTVGFACSIYRRGVPYTRIPTTLIGLVDAGIGVKTAINADRHKSRLGSYYPPRIAIIDPAFLRSLPAREIACGTAEIVKISAVCDAGLFGLVEHNIRGLLDGNYQHPQIGDEVLRRAISAMLGQLSGNLWEDNLNRTVDFGHTFSPGLELRDPGLQHGEAVALDMGISCCLAVVRQVLAAEERDRVLSLLKASGLPISHRLLDARTLAHALHETTVHRDGRQRLPVPSPRLGSAAFLEAVDAAELELAVKQLAAWDTGHHRSAADGKPMKPSR